MFAVSPLVPAAGPLLLGRLISIAQSAKVNLSRLGSLDSELGIAILLLPARPFAQRILVQWPGVVAEEVIVIIVVPEVPPEFLFVCFIVGIVVYFNLNFGEVVVGFHILVIKHLRLGKAEGLEVVLGVHEELVRLGQHGCLDVANVIALELVCKNIPEG